MEAIRLKKHIESETVYLPELRPLIGKDVEIIVLDESDEEGKHPSAVAQYPLRGSVLRYDEPFEPVAEDDWEALR